MNPLADFPELLDEPETGLYVRRERSQGYTVAECRAINALRNVIRNGECIETEAVLQLVRQASAMLAAAPSPPGGSGVRELVEALAKYDALRDHIGSCTDGGCLVKRPTGMHTNGGCKCFKDPIKTQRMMYAGQELSSALRTWLNENNGGGTK